MASPKTEAPPSLAASTTRAALQSSRVTLLHRPTTTVSAPVHNGVVSKRNNSGIGKRELICPHTNPATTRPTIRRYDAMSLISPSAQRRLQQRLVRQEPLVTALGYRCD